MDKIFDVKNFELVKNYFFPGNCFEELLIKINIFHKTCPQILISRLLGVAITLGSSFLLVPQILKIHYSRSGEGISMIAQILGLIGAAGTASYSYEKNFVFGQWGDSLFVAIQMMVIVMQIMYFQGYKAEAIAFMSVCWSFGMAVNHHYIPLSVLEIVQALVIPIVFLSKGTQIYANYSQSGTGQLAITSVAMQFFGCVARVFTSIQETSGDIFIIGQFVLASMLNGIILAQIIYYGSGKKVTLDKKEDLLKARLRESTTLKKKEKLGAK